MNEHDDHSVSYTVKELLARMDVRLELMQNTLESSAKREDVTKLDRRVTVIETQMRERNRMQLVYISLIQIVVAATAVVISSRIGH